MRIEGFSSFGGRHPEIAALRNLLTHHGITAPHTGQPFSEAFLYGVGGGIGFTYFLFERRGTHPIFLGTRIHTRETERPEYFQTIAQRIGFGLQVQNSSSATAALSNMRKTLTAGQPLLVWTDASRLPYTGQYGFGTFYHVVLVCGVDENDNNVFVSDRAPEPFTVGLQEFRFARETSWSPKYRAAAVVPGEGCDPAAAAEAGIRSCLEQMQRGLGVTNFGLKGMEKWATMLLSAKEKKSWIKVFGSGRGLYCSLYSVFEQIRNRGDVGSAARTLYAEFLEHAAELLGRPGLKDAAQLFRDSEAAWSETADAHLPEAVPGFREARELSIERRTLFETRGGEARDRLREIRDRLAALERDSTAVFPLPEPEIRSLLEHLRERITGLRDREAQAVEALAAVMA